MGEREVLSIDAEGLDQLMDVAPEHVADLGPWGGVMNVLKGNVRAAGDFKRYDGRPLEFIREVLGVTLWSKQEEVILACCSHPGVVFKLMVRAGHSVGKSFLAACLVLYWLYAHQGRVVTTAPTKELVETVLWNSIHQLRAGALVELPVDARPGLVRLSVNASTGVQAFGMTSGKDAGGTGSQGKHHKRLLVIADECYGIDAVFWDPLISQASDEGNVVLAIGNPTDPASMAAVLDRKGVEYDPAERDEKKLSLWQRMKISCLEHPNYIARKSVIPGGVSYHEVEAKRETHGENSSTFACRVLGEYPKEDADQILVPYVQTMRCVRGRHDEVEDLQGEALEERLTELYTHPRRLGVDIGGTNDPTAVARARGLYIESITLHPGLLQDAIVDLIIQTLAEVEGTHANYDGGGLGVGVSQSLKKLKANATDVQFNGKPFHQPTKKQLRTGTDRIEFANRRAEMYWRLREAIRTRALSLPPGKYAEMLAEELSLLKWEEVNGKIQMEPKARLKSRLGRSPDVSDAVCLAIAALAKKPYRMLVAAS
jgi:hypothetical protein